MLGLRKVKGATVSLCRGSDYVNQESDYGRYVSFEYEPAVVLRIYELVDVHSSGKSTIVMIAKPNESS